MIKYEQFPDVLFVVLYPSFVLNRIEVYLLHTKQVDDSYYTFQS
jgi:hypothetical protein